MNNSKLYIGIGIPAIIGALIGAFIWKRNNRNGWWGALIGAIVIPIIWAIIDSTFSITTKKG